MNTKRENKKQQEMIAAILKNRGFDCYKIINETDNALLVVYGYKNHKLSELVKHNLKTKTNNVVLVDGEVSFNDFVIKAKKYTSVNG